LVAFVVQREREVTNYIDVRELWNSEIGFYLNSFFFIRFSPIRFARVLPVLWA
jgi:hypothetical protein